MKENLPRTGRTLPDLINVEGLRRFRWSLNFSQIYVSHRWRDPPALERFRSHCEGKTIKTNFMEM